MASLRPEWRRECRPANERERPERLILAEKSRGRGSMKGGRSVIGATRRVAAVGNARIGRESAVPKVDSARPMLTGPDVS